MSCRKLLRHDLVCGLIRWWYLLAAVFAWFPCIACRSGVALAGTPGSWMDYMLYCFKGTVPMNVGQANFWMLVMAGCLILNLDYLRSDLTQAGQQVIFRTGARWKWYLSKFVWNLCSCGIYMALICAAVLAFTLLFGGAASLNSTYDLLKIHFPEVMAGPVELTAVQGLVAVVAMPLVTLMALGMVQMALCLLVRPVIGFLISLAVLMLAVFWDFPLALGTGAMAVRSVYLVSDGVDPGKAALVAGVVMLAGVVAGCLRFRYTDILGMDE